MSTKMNRRRAVPVRWLLAERLRAPDCEAPQTARQVGVALCVYWMDDYGSCWPSYATIGKVCGITRWAVMDAIKWLVDHEYLISEPRKHKDGRLSNVLRVDRFPGLCASCGGDDLEGHHPECKVVTYDHQVVTYDHQGGDLRSQEQHH